jgi:hypothetical protein
MAVKPNGLLIYCRDGLVVAQHKEAQAVDPLEYGAGTTTQLDDDTFVWEREGDPPPEGQPDSRPTKCPF